jgi:hypothetical protein
VGGGGEGAGVVRAGDGAGGAVVGGEVVEHPDGVEDGETLFVLDEAHVAVEGLGGVGVGFGGAVVEARKLPVRAEDGFDGGEEDGMGDDATEGFAFVDEVGEALGVGLFTELGAGLFAFDGHALGDGGAEFGEPGGVDHLGDDRVPLIVQLFYVLAIHVGIVSQ